VTDSLEKVAERFPMAQVSGAQSLAEIDAQWKERGYIGRLLTKEQTIQRIVIERDPIEGKLTWTISPNQDGLLAVLNATSAAYLMPCVVVGDVAQSIAEYFCVGDGRVDIGSGKAVVIVAFKDGKLAIDFEPRGAPIAAKKLLAIALLRLLAEDAGLPIDKIMQAIG
jgi:hypothetical protein